LDRLRVRINIIVLKVIFFKLANCSEQRAMISIYIDYVLCAQIQDLCFAFVNELLQFMYRIYLLLLYTVSQKTSRTFWIVT